MNDLDIEMLVATSKAKLFAYVEQDVKDELERLAESRNRSLSNLVETLVIQELERARQTGELSEESR